jgi:lipopolysaccharide exporter
MRLAAGGGTLFTVPVSVAARAVSGAAWNLATGVGSRVVALVGTLILTRFIAPTEYGEITAAVVAIATAMTFTDACVGQSILARRIGPDSCFHGFVLHLLTGLVGLATVVLSAPYLGGWLDAPGMARFVPGFAGAALLERASYVPGKILLRDMRFRTVALTRGTAELVFTAVSLALAPYVHGYAIVAGNLARSAFLMVVYALRADHRKWFVPQRLRWPVVRDLLGFGLPLSAGSIAGFAASNWDNLLVGRFFGASTLGAYRLSQSLAATPVTNVAEQLGDVLLPAFAHLDVERRRTGLLRAAAIMALVTFPLSWGLAAVAPTIVRTLFDRRWAGIAPMLMILSAMATPRPMTWALTAFLQAQQRPRAVMLLSVLNLGTMLALLATFGRLGPSWACLAVGSASLVHCSGMLYVAHVSEQVPGRRFLATVLRPVVASAFMFLVVAMARYALERLGIQPTWTSLAIEVTIGAVAYVGAACVIAQATVRDVLDLAGGILKGTRSAAQEEAAPHLSGTGAPT